MHPKTFKQKQKVVVMLGVSFLLVTTARNKALPLLRFFSVKLREILGPLEEEFRFDFFEGLFWELLLEDLEVDMFIAD